MTDIDIDKLAAKVAEHMQAGTFARPLLSAQGVAERLGISTRTARELIGNGTIASFKVGGARRVDPREVDAYLARLKESRSEPEIREEER